MQPTYLTLAYDGNYVGRSPLGGWEMFTYNGELWIVNPATDQAVPFPSM